MARLFVGMCRLSQKIAAGAGNSSRPSMYHVHVHAGLMPISRGDQGTGELYAWIHLKTPVANLWNMFAGFIGSICGGALFVRLSGLSLQGART